MDELKKLERTQAILGLMQTHHSALTAPPDPDSDRFLADLLLLLVQPCGGLSVERKCGLVSEFMPKISRSLLEEAAHLVVEDCAGEMEDQDFGCCFSEDGGGDRGVILGGPDNEVMIGLQAMQRANSTLEDFCRSYFMFHDMDVSKPELIFKFLPVLAFTEAYIYQLDDMNERLVMDGVQLMKKNGEDAGHSGAYINELRRNPFGPLLQQLEFRELLNNRIEEELKAGEEYWALERKLCFALKIKAEVQVEEVMRAIHLKSFDYRVLNLLLYQLRGAQVDILHMDFLSISELLVEISDDLLGNGRGLIPPTLLTIQDDVLKNNFNILRMFVHVYGASAAPTMLAKYIAEVEEKYNTLLKALGPQLSAAYQRRCEDATMEGGNVGGHPLGTWNIPPVIVDEDSYRLTFGTRQ